MGNLAAKIMMDVLLWVEAQFYTLGFIEEASDLSLGLMYRLQGIFLLGRALKDPNLITRQVALLQDFLGDLGSLAQNLQAKVVPQKEKSALLCS